MGKGYNPYNLNLCLGFNLTYCCTPYIMDSHTSIDKRQRERQSSSISVTQSRVIPFVLWTDSHYPTGLSASYQLTTV